MVDSSNFILWKCTSSEGLVYFLVLLTERCFQFLTFRSPEVGMFVSTSCTKHKRSLWSVISVFSIPAVEVPEETYFDFLRSFALSMGVCFVLCHELVGNDLG